MNHPSTHSAIMSPSDARRGPDARIFRGASPFQGTKRKRISLVCRHAADIGAFPQRQRFSARAGSNSQKKAL